jgi:hypothetical protein
MPKATKKKPQKKQQPTTHDALVHMGENAHANATPSGNPPPLADADETVTVGELTLEQTPTRLMTLLRGIGTIRPVRDVLRPLGYTPDEHARGWGLLHRCSGFVEGESADDTDVADTIAEIDAWDEPTFTIAEAALRHRHPAQHAFVFRDLKPSRGVAAVVGAHTFLSRLDALESAPERAATRAADHAALATLAARGVTPEERTRVWAMVHDAERLTDDAAPDSRELSAAEQQGRLREARAFYEEWSTIARTLVTRRDLLIRLGLAQRKAPAAAEEPAGPTPAEPQGNGAPKPG